MPGIFKNILPVLLAIWMMLDGVSSKAQYCQPAYINGGCTLPFNVHDINDFTLSGNGGEAIIDMATGCSPASYGDRTLLFTPLKLIQGEVYYGMMSSTDGANRAKIWIDFNDDTVFQPSDSATVEHVMISNSNESYPYSIYIPGNVDTGLHRMRVRLVNPMGFGYMPVEPCTQEFFGEIHDYTVRIIEALSNDIGVTVITEPQENSIFCSGTTVNVRVVVNNLGSDPQSGFNIYASYSGTTSGMMQMPYGGTLAPHTHDTVDLGQFIIASGGNYLLKSYTAMTGDLRTANDTSFTQILVDTSPQAILHDTAICLTDLPFTLNAGNSGCVYVWNTLSTSQSIQAAAAGIYTVEITSSQGCFLKDTIDLSIKPLPTVAGIAVGGSGNSFIFGPGNPQNAGSYFWDFGDGETDNASNTTHTYTLSGTYTVKLIVSNECGTDTAIFQVIVFPTYAEMIAIQERKILLYPNPAKEILNIELSKEIGAVQYLIMNTNGDLVYNIRPEQMTGKYAIDLKHFVPGSYVLIVKSEEGSFYKMFQVRN